MVLDYKRCITLESRAHVTLQPYGQTLPIILVRHWDYRSIGAKPELVRVTVRWNFSGSAFLRTEKKWEARNSSGPEKSSFPAKKIPFPVSASVTGVSFAANGRGGFYREPRLNKSESVALDRHLDFDAQNANVVEGSMRRSSTERNVASSSSSSFAPLSPHSIDER